MKDTRKLTAGGALIFEEVIAVLQKAEELGGPNESDDYLNLMDKIEIQVQLRKVNCIANRYGGKDLTNALKIVRPRR